MSAFPFTEEYSQMIDALKEAKQKITSISSQKSIVLQKRIIIDLDKHINFLLANSGQPLEKPVLNKTLGVPSREVRPLRSILGKPVRGATQPGSVNDLPSTNEARKITKYFESSKDVAQAELNSVIEKLYPDFIRIDTPQIIDSYSDIEIREVALRAGMTYVSQKNPKRITAKFVEEIKDAIRMKAEKDKAGEEVLEGSTEVE